jgi:hypothetical protein
MERNTVTTIDVLQMGDRFYKAGNAKKEMYTVVKVKPLKNKYFILVYGALKDGEKYPVHIKKETKLVFVRHAQIAAHV